MFKCCVMPLVYKATYLPLLSDVRKKKIQKKSKRGSFFSELYCFAQDTFPIYCATIKTRKILLYFSSEGKKITQCTFKKYFSYIKLFVKFTKYKYRIYALYEMIECNM